jgi:ubiquinone/menaquinone biosynthesis C-methylase UbiE
VLPTSERKRDVPSDFDRVADSYDLLTGLNPGYHRHLRLSAERLRVPHTIGTNGQSRRPRLLDLCCGTGLSTEALRIVYPDASIVALDASARMLDIARRKSILRSVELVHGDATDPRAAGVGGRFDGIMMAYGIRNVPDADRCLANLRELLVPGAPIVFHEYSVRDSLTARAVWDAVCFGIIIPGGLVTNRDTRIYRYLQHSVRSFDGVRDFEARLSRAGLERVRTEPMDGWQRGIVHSFVAHAPLEPPLERAGDAR